MIIRQSQKAHEYLSVIIAWLRFSYGGGNMKNNYLIVNPVVLTLALARMGCLLGFSAFAGNSQTVGLALYAKPLLTFACETGGCYE